MNLQTLYLHNTLENWSISLLIFASAIVFVILLSLLNKYIFIKLAKKTKLKLDDELLKALQSPVCFGILLFAFFIAEKRLIVPEKIQHSFTTAYQILTVLNITWLITRFVKTIFSTLVRKHSGKEKQVDARFYPLIRRTLLIVIWCVGIVMALNNAGISVSTLLATLGIGGLAFALAAQDTIKNIFGGVTIFSDRPFRIGDRIQINNIDGFVKDIGLRSTKIQTLDNRLVTMPNSQVSDAAVINVSSEPTRKVPMTLGLVYDTPPDKMKTALSILKDVSQNISGVYEKDIVASFTDFAASSLNITFVYYIKHDANIYDTMNAVNLYILSAFNENGLSFAFPTVTITK
ncbi:MAG: mechanosensitive ion channel family protein [Bacteroidales bacterium]|jgi:MscS family membrane protein|nr:mechanosensitive ion channel family protein [Bacteroidales bacterium]